MTFTGLAPGRYEDLVLRARVTATPERRAAACVNILADCTSVYRWQDQLEEASEVPVLVKTTEAAYPALEQVIRDLHPYELPEIVAVPLSRGLPAYLDWVIAETRSGPDS